MRFLRSVGTLLSAALLFAATSSADVVFSNLSLGLDGGGGGLVLGARAAAAVNEPVQTIPGLFQSSGNFALSSVTVGVSLDPIPTISDPSPQFDVWLYSDAYGCVLIGHTYTCGHNPGSPITEIAQNLTAVGTDPNPSLVTSGPIEGTVTVAAGDFYWIVLTPANPDTDIIWNDTDAGPYALELNGTASAPEPATITLFALALIGLPLLRKRE